MLRVWFAPRYAGEPFAAIDLAAAASVDALVERPPHVDKNDARYFTIKSGTVEVITLKSVTDGEPDKKWIVCIASSSVTDRCGDDVVSIIVPARDEERSIETCV